MENPGRIVERGSRTQHDVVSVVQPQRFLASRPVRGHLSFSRRPRIDGVKRSRRLAEGPPLCATDLNRKDPGGVKVSRQSRGLIGPEHPRADAGHAEIDRKRPKRPNTPGESTTSVAESGGRVKRLYCRPRGERREPAQYRQAAPFISIQRRL